MSSEKSNQKRLQNPANFAAAALNIPVMVVAGTIIGIFLSNDQESPLAELIIIGSIMLFFSLSMLELYYIARKQNSSKKWKRDKFSGLKQIIEDNTD